jgi:hypothetical protein
VPEQAAYRAAGAIGVFARTVAGTLGGDLRGVAKMLLDFTVMHGVLPPGRWGSTLPAAP